ncbi:membrane protein [Neisseria gonorrhoeae]|uniref:Membrane protein n=1 Tax=Neisseria gonorrhoeae TaxID=485 RepID=A0A378W1J3_NEIGO|nr:membrane protein [Neisseria gonorrhoeae]
MPSSTAPGARKHRPLFLKSVNGKGGLWHVIFLILVVMNLVSGFQALGILMSVGLMMLPAITARLWARIWGRSFCCPSSSPFLRFDRAAHFLPHRNPFRPAIILCCSVLYLFSVILGKEGGILPKWFKNHRHHTT